MQDVDARTADLIARGGGEFGLRQPLREWYGLFPQSFYRIASDLDPQGIRAVLELLYADPDCCRHLCDADILDLPGAIRLARSLATLDPEFDLRLGRAAVAWRQEGCEAHSLRRCIRILEILARGTRVNVFLVQLLISNDGAVRSLVFKFLIRNACNERMIRTWMQDRDARVRANLIESLSHLQPVPQWARQIFLDSMKDESGRTAANAAVALFRMGYRSESVAELRQMAQSNNPALVCSGLWAMGSVGWPGLEAVANELRGNPDRRIRWAALRSLTRIRKRVSAAPPPEPVEVSPSAELIPETLPVTEPESIAVGDATNPEPEKTVRPYFTRTFGRLI